MAAVWACATCRDWGIEPNAEAGSAEDVSPSCTVASVPAWPVRSFAASVRALTVTR